MIYLKQFKASSTKEEQVAFWDELGFLDGLTNEDKEKCAEAYTNLANFIMEKGLGEDLFATLGFPIVRRIAVNCPNFDAEDIKIQTIYDIYSDVFNYFLYLLKPLNEKYGIDACSEVTQMTVKAIETFLKK